MVDVPASHVRFSRGASLRDTVRLLGNNVRVKQSCISEPPRQCKTNDVFFPVVETNGSVNRLVRLLDWIDMGCNDNIGVRRYHPKSAYKRVLIQAAYSVVFLHEASNKMA